jgi:hypothetical protein
MCRYLFADVHPVYLFLISFLYFKVPGDQGMAKTTTPPDLMSQALSDREVEEYFAKRHLPERRKRHRQWAVQGPFPWRQWCLVSQLPGKSLVVWQLIHHRSKLYRQSWVTLPLELLVEIGLSRRAKDLALHSLERHGLILVDRHPGRATRIALVAAEPDEGDEE